MKKQHGKMGAGIIALISIVSIIVLVVVTCIASYVKYHDYAAGAENTVKAEYKNMENILAQYSLKIGEAIQSIDSLRISVCLLSVVLRCVSAQVV